MIGTVQHIDYTPGSGLATVVLLTDEGDIERLHCDAGPLFRSISDLDRMIIGLRINCEITDFGTLGSFTVED